MTNLLVATALIGGNTKSTDVAGKSQALDQSAMIGDPDGKQFSDVLAEQSSGGNADDIWADVKLQHSASPEDSAESSASSQTPANETDADIANRQRTANTTATDLTDVVLITAEEPQRLGEDAGAITKQQGNAKQEQGAIIDPHLLVGTPSNMLPINAPAVPTLNESPQKPGTLPQVHVAKQGFSPPVPEPKVDPAKVPQIAPTDGKQMSPQDAQILDSRNRSISVEQAKVGAALSSTQKSEFANLRDTMTKAAFEDARHQNQQVDRQNARIANAAYNVVTTGSPPTNSGVANAGYTLVNAAATTQLTKGDGVKATDPILVQDGDFAMTFNDVKTASTQPTNLSSPISQSHHPALARHVAMQMADALRASPNRPIEISLNPAELGRIKMTITASDGAVSLQILAERPETLEWMRRNMDMLSRDLGDNGFTSIDLAFGKGKDAEPHDGPVLGAFENSLDDDFDDIPPPATHTPHRIQIDGSGRVDIRV